MLKMDSNALYIETDPHMEVLCDQARYERRVGIDLEFIRQRTYFAKLALVQVAVGEQLFLIDPLGDVDLAPLDSLMVDPNVCKVLHAPSQDLEIFFHRLGEPPCNIYDTQMAAAMVGLGHQVAYSTLVSIQLGVELHHSEGFTDWLQRPLTPNQEAYALDDVRYLFALQDSLSVLLDNMGRRSWFIEECARYEQRERYQAQPEQLYTNVKSRNKLSPQGLAILRELAIWREHEAIHQDRPRRTIVLDEVLVEIARRAPR
ncbi:MAG: HRDC domain-containing protein, partial [Myxococcota bacterium]